MEEFISRIYEINKEKLNEREFYEHVLNVVKDMGNVSLTPQNSEQLKKALQEIGCMRYNEWKKQKEENVEMVEENNAEDGIKNADISVAVSFVSQLLGDYNNTSFSLPHIIDGGEETGWVQQWLRNSQEKKQFKHNIPYYQVAKQALVKWNNLSEKEAEKVISTQSFDEIESQVHAKSSIDYAVEGIKECLRLSDKDAKELSSFIYEGNESKIINSWKQVINFQNISLGVQREHFTRNNEEMFNNLIINTLFHVHDGWVKDNVNKFNARERKHQHMPSELIGWEEAKADLLFIKPIFQSAGIEVNDKELEQVYNDRVKDFFLDKKIITTRDLVDLITQGEKFYPALEGYGEILTLIKDTDYVKNKIIPAIEQQGIGNIEETRRNIVSQIISKLIPEDISRLSDDEKINAENALGQEVDALIEKRDELHKKNSIVRRIISLVKRREGLRKEILEEEQKKDENIYDFNK